MPNFLETSKSIEVALKALQMYTAQHPRTQGSLLAARNELQVAIGDQASLNLAVAEGKVIVDGTKVEGMSPHLVAIARRFSDRMIAGFVIEKTFSEGDLLAMLNLLLLKPAKIEELGGAVQVLEQAGATGIRVSKTYFKEMGEGDSVVSGDGEASAESSKKDAPGDASSPETAADGDGQGPESGGTSESLVNLVREALLGILGGNLSGKNGGGEGGQDFAGIQPAFLGDLGPLGYQLGLGEGMPTSAQMGVLRQVLLSLPPESQMSLLSGIATLPGEPEGLALGIKALAPEILSVATTGLLGQGAAWDQVQGVLQDLLRSLPNRDSLLRALALQMHGAGLDGGLLEGLLRRMDWESMSLEAKVVRALEGRQLWDLSLEERLAFLRELLNEERNEAFLRVLERVLEFLQVEDQALRLAAALTLAGVSPWMRQPGLPIGAEGPLIQKLQAHFAIETSAQIYQASTEALAMVLSALVLRGDVGAAQACLSEVRDLCGIHEEIQPWREEGLHMLWDRLLREDCAERTLQLLYEADKARLASEVLPYLEWLGQDAAAFLMDKLGNETDRNRRGRIMEALRVLGPLAMDAVRVALQEQTWYLNRNALNLLSDIGTADALPEVIPFLRHKDGRVRRAAVRTMWKLGGPAAEQPLLSLLEQTDPDTQMEVIFALGQLRSVGSASAVLEMAQNRRAHGALRAKALETLGLIGSNATVPAIGELITRKSFFGGFTEPFDIRLGAAKSLQGIGTPEARWALRKIVDSLSKGAEREALQRVLDGFAEK